MKIEIPKASQIKIVISFVIVAALITLVVVFRDSIFKISQNISDNERFYREYNLTGVDNVFKYVTIDQAIEKLKSEQAIVYFGFEACPWCQHYAPILNQAAKASGVDEIFYCDIREARKSNTEEYQALVSALGDNLQNDANGNKRVYVPDVYFIKDGQIAGHNNDTSTIEGADVEDYYTDSVTTELKTKLLELISKVYTPVCEDESKGC